MRVGIVIVSDRASNDSGVDRSTSIISKFLSDKYPNSKVVYQTIVPDDRYQIQSALIQGCDQTRCDLLLTSGGTGFSERDITPEAVGPLLEKHASGLVHLMLQYATVNCTPLAALSRPVAGVRGQTLVITLPGSPKACVENLTALLPVLGHAVDLLCSSSDAASKTAKTMAMATKQKVQQFHDSMITPFLDANSRKEGDRKSLHGCNCDRDNDDGNQNYTSSGTALTESSARPRQSPYEMVPVQRAMEIIFDRCHSVRIAKPTDVDRQLIGTALAEDLHSAVNVPEFNASFVDGYAVHAPINADQDFLVTQDPSLLSNKMSGAADKQYAVRINTGSVVPEEANAIIMVEDTELTDRSDKDGSEIRIRIRKQSERLSFAVNPGDFIRKQGSDIAKGSKLIDAGSPISTVGAELSMLLAGGINKVQAYQKPIIAVISSGNEIVPPNTTPLPFGKVRDINSSLLISCLEQHGFKSIDLGIVPDDPALLQETLTRAGEKAQVVITTGGVSMGDRDYMKSVLQLIGAKIHFGRVNVKPGKPTTFASTDKTLYFGLPGNPVSAVVMFHIFVLPALRCLCGHRKPSLRMATVTIAHDIELDQRPEYHRATLDFHTMVAQSTGLQTSSRTQSLAGANCLLQLPGRTSDCRALERGSTVPAVLLI